MILAYDATFGDEVDIKNKNFYDQLINSLIKHYDKVRRMSIGKAMIILQDVYLEHAYCKDDYKLIAVDLSKQKALDADPRAFQQIAFQEIAGQKLRLHSS